MPNNRLIFRKFLKEKSGLPKSSDRRRTFPSMEVRCSCCFRTCQGSDMQPIIVEFMAVTARAGEREQKPR